MTTLPLSKAAHAFNFFAPRRAGIILSLSAALLASPVEAAKTKKNPSSKPVPVAAFTLTGCDSCSTFKNILRRNGTALRVTKIGERPYSAYPVVQYSDGRVDYGDRIFAKRVSFPKTLKVYETD